MRGFFTALWSETLKARRSKMLPATILVFAIFGAMMSLLMLVALHPELAGRSETLKVKSSFIANPDWPHFFSLLIQAILALGPMGFGFVTSWVFGREYSDRVIKDMLALPISRSLIVLSKFAVVLVWNLILSIVIISTAVLTGWAIQLPGWSAELADRMLRLFSCSAVLTILLTPPVAFIASAGRGYLPPIGFVILILILTQFAGIGFPEFMPYFPWAVPALASGLAGADIPRPQVVSYVLLGLTSLAGLIGTMAWWRFADQV